MGMEGFRFFVSVRCPSSLLTITSPYLFFYDDDDEGNGNVYTGIQWEWEQMFGWHGNGNGIETYGNGKELES